MNIKWKSIILMTLVSVYGAEMAADNDASEQVWILDSLVIPASSDAASQVLLDFSADGAAIATVEFLLQAGDLRISFDGDSALILSVGEDFLLVTLDGPATSESFEFALEGEGLLPVRLDQRIGKLELADSVLDISGVTGDVRVYTLDFQNVGTVEVTLVELAVTSEPPEPPHSGFTGDDSPGAEAESARARTRRTAAFPHIPIDRPPPHPWLAMDEERRLLVAPGVPMEGPNGRLHRRPGIIPEPVVRRLVEAAGATEE